MRNKKSALLTSAVILLPVLAGLLLWNRLPERVVTHWGLDGTPDGWSSKAFAVFFFPLFLLAVHWVCLLVTAKDKGNREQNPKLTALVVWTTPVIGLFVSGIVYAAALGQTLNVGKCALLLLGVMFLVIGNYLPKCRPNRTIGIKVKWTFESEANWAATHRLAGRLWVAGGALFVICAFLPYAIMVWVCMAAVVPMTVIPILYSYFFHKKEKSEG